MLSIQEHPSDKPFTARLMGFSLFGYSLKRNATLQQVVDRLQDIQTSAERWCMDCDVVGLEGLAYNAGGASASQAPALWYQTVGALLNHHKVENIIPVAPTSVKKALTGQGRAHKDKVAQAVYDRVEGAQKCLGQVPAHLRHNLTDAIAVALSAYTRWSEGDE